MNRKYTIVAALTGVALALTACSSSKSSDSGSGSSTGASDGGSIIVGSGVDTESLLLANIYAEAMSAKGVKVTKKLSIGDRSIRVSALKDGSIDFVPEFSGSILDFLDPKATAKSPADVYAALPTAIGSTFSVYKYAEAQDNDTITVTKDYATKNNLTKISDLVPIADKFTFGAPAGFATRPDGIPSLKSLYGITFKAFTPIAPTGTLTVDALKSGTVDGADIFSTDASIAANNFVSLTDDKNMFAAQNVIPLLTKSKSTPTAEAACNAVSAKLDTKTLADLDAKAGKGDSVTVAKDWLKSQGLI
jgi:osmoprotectant transport system substrate-binding protein